MLNANQVTITAEPEMVLNYQHSIIEVLKHQGETHQDLPNNVVQSNYYLLDLLQQLLPTESQLKAGVEAVKPMRV